MLRVRSFLLPEPVDVLLSRGIHVGSMMTTSKSTGKGEAKAKATAKSTAKPKTASKPKAQSVVAEGVATPAPAKRAPTKGTKANTRLGPTLVIVESPTKAK